ncbi:hypothetical protein Emed_000747 [Eimeria media]
MRRDQETVKQDEHLPTRTERSSTTEGVQGTEDPRQRTSQYHPYSFDGQFEQTEEQPRQQQQIEEPVEKPEGQHVQEGLQLTNEQEAHEHEPALGSPKGSGNRQSERTSESRHLRRSLLSTPAENSERPPADAEGDGPDGRSRRAKKVKPSKRAASNSSTPACQDGTEPVELGKPQEPLTDTDTLAKRATAVLFDSQTATALQSLCALQEPMPSLGLTLQDQSSLAFFGAVSESTFGQQQAPTTHLSSANPDDKELEELEHSFVSADDAAQTQALETALKISPQSLSEYNCLLVPLQGNALTDCNEALEPEEVVVGFAKDSEARRHMAAEAEMSRTLRSLQMRLEAIFQHRCLDVLNSYGFLKRDLRLTDFSLRKTVPRAARRALGFEGENEEPKWRRMSQSVRLRLDMCRAVKDGVPRGQYVMMVSVWNKLVAFAAMYFSECLSDVQMLGIAALFDETVYFNCPSESDLRPSMCLVFQLYLLRGAVSPIDKVVAWGAFPLVGPEGRIVEGAFKVPLLLGEVDTSIQRYVDMEASARMGLDSWLCNFYFRIGRVPKELNGLQEFEVPLHYTGRLLEIPHELPPPKESRRASSLRSSRSSHSSLRSSIGGTEEDRKNRQRSLSYGMRPFVNASEQELALYQYAGALWFVVFVALFGSWISLKAFGIPVYSAEISGLYIRFGYVQELLSLGPAAVLAGSGFLTATIVFSLLCAVAHLAHCSIGRLPNADGAQSPAANCFLSCCAAYRFMAPLGLWVVFLPIVLALVEGAGGETLGVTFALSSYLEREAGSKGLGIALTVLMDIAFMAVSSVLFYYYAVAIHQHGRVLDCHRRVTADPSAFKLPSDNQVSAKYMQSCCYRAKQFLGLEGETRRGWHHVLEVIMPQRPLPALLQLVNLPRRLSMQFRHPDGTIVEQRYSAPLGLDFSASTPPPKVLQRSFEESGFLQHQPTETFLTFEEWRSCRFGNMPPVVLSSNADKVLECKSTETASLEHEEAAPLEDYIVGTPIDGREEGHLQMTEIDTFPLS